MFFIQKICGDGDDLRKTLFALAEGNVKDYTYLLENISYEELPSTIDLAEKESARRRKELEDMKKK